MIINYNNSIFANTTDSGIGHTFLYRRVNLLTKQYKSSVYVFFYFFINNNNKIHVYKKKCKKKKEKK